MLAVCFKTPSASARPIGGRMAAVIWGQFNENTMPSQKERRHGHESGRITGKIGVPEKAPRWEGWWQWRGWIGAFSVGHPTRSQADGRGQPRPDGGERVEMRRPPSRSQEGGYASPLEEGREGFGR